MNLYIRVVASLLVIALLAYFGCTNPDQKAPNDLSDEEISLYRNAGSELAGSTQKVLASNLVGAIQQNGTPEALEFCNIRAIPLTDSMSIELEAHIKRVTDQPRNPDNLANDPEMEYIQSAKKIISDGKEVIPSLKRSDGTVTGYYPIITNQLCMQCHGSKGAQIDDKTLTKINDLYPNDKAIGYDIGQLRGIWVVEMKIDSLQK